MNDIEMLKGKILKGVKRGTASEIPPGASAYGGVHGQNQETLTFECEDGPYVFLADGDCCSQTYIDSVEGPTEGIILEVRQPEWGDSERKVETDDGCTQFYKATFVIEGKGFLDVTYRNESNGYYGGSLSLLSAPSGGVGHGQ